MRKSIIKLLGFIFFSTALAIQIVFSQGGINEGSGPNIKQNLPSYDLIPISPNASSLGQYGDIKVGLYTGAPGVSIPIYEIKSRKLSMPISLNYVSSGIKVTDIASWVGLGWNLNIGGVITRNVNGLPDERANSVINYIETSTPGYFYQGGQYLQEYTKDQKTNLIGDQPIRTVKFAADGLLDTEPDIFFYNFNGRSGKIVFDRFRNPYCIPANNLKIQWDFEDQWTVITEDGTKYIFGKSLDGTKVAVERTKIETGCNENSSQQDYRMSWYLLSIISPDNTDAINFDYTNVDNVSLDPIVSFSATSVLVGQDIPDRDNISQLCDNSRCICVCPKTKSNGLAILNTCYTLTKTNMVYLNKVSWASGYLSLSLSDRLDLNGAKKLDKIQVFNPDQTPYKQFNFKYYYFNADISTCYQTTLPNFSNSQVAKRLKFSSFEEVGLESKKYSFEYDTSRGNLPCRTSLARDHWGYYNNKIYNNTLIPLDQFQALTPNLSNGGDREPNESYMKTFILNKIVYPTGGISLLEYEPHQYAVSPTSSTTKMAGGLRIKKITNYLKDYPYSIDDIASVKKYSYANGSLLNPPVYKYLTHESRVIATGSLCDDPFFYNVNDYYNYNSGSLNILGETDGSHVGYQYVDEIFGENGENGKTRFEYISPIEVPDNYSNAPPFVYESFDYARGKLRKKTIYDKDGNKKYQLENIYKSNFTDFKKTKIIPGFKSSQIYFEVLGSSNNPMLSDYAYSSYRIISSDYTLESTTETTFEQSDVTKSVSTTKYFTNDENDLNVLSESYINSKSERLTSNFKYPSDYLPQTLLNERNTYLNNYTSSINSCNSTFNSCPSSTQNLRDGCFSSYSQCVLNALNIRKVAEQQYLTNINSLIANTTDIEQKTALKLYQNNELTKLIEQNQEIGSRDRFYISGLKNSYKEYGSGKIYLDTQYLHESKTLSTSLNYVPKMFLNAYDTYGNILQFQKADDFISSYKWGYNFQFPIAKISNASSNEFYVENFEESTQIGVIKTGGARTGNSYFGTTPYTVNWTKPNFRNYKISYWYKTGGNWVFSGELSYTSPSMILTNGSAYDDIRIYPSDSQISTYTFSPLLGITSETSPQNITTYYEYDGLNRLKLIKDNDSKILKLFKYGYSGN